MGERADYPVGVPCWVDTYQPDPEAAIRFYEGVLGWDFDTSAPPAGSHAMDYFVARFRGREVAAVGASSASSAPTGTAWNTYVAVQQLEVCLSRATAAGGSVVVAPVDQSPASRWALIADPSGAEIGLWEQGVRRGAELVNESGAWALSMLHTAELDRACEFYSTLFGWRPESFLNAPGSEMIACRLPGYFGGVAEQPVPRDVVAVLVPAPPDSKPYWQVRFWVDDLNAAATTASRLGGQIVFDSRETSGSTWLVLADPGGTRFTLDVPAKSA